MMLMVPEQQPASSMVHYQLHHSTASCQQGPQHLCLLPPPLAACHAC
jgi:hypothetical protein